MKIKPVWSKDLEGLTAYSYWNLARCANVILSNYDCLKIGHASFSTAQIFGPQLVAYQHSPIAEDEQKELRPSLTSSLVNSSFKDMEAKTKCFNSSLKKTKA